MSRSTWITSIACRLAVVLLAASALAGCSPAAEPQGIWAKLWSLEVGPDYKRPQVNAPETFRSHLGPSEAASLADQPWWTVFKDKVLQRLVVTALTHNYDLQLAAARVEQARALVGVAASSLYPQVSYQGLAGREKALFVPLEEFGGNITFNAFAGLFNVVWEIDIWGRIRRSTEAARASLFSQEESPRCVLMLTLVSEVAAGYFQLLELDRELQIAQNSSQTYKQTLDLFTQRFELGRDSKIAG